MSRRIAIVTGTRAEYGLLRPILRAIRRTRGLSLQVVAAGMHLDRRFGHTVDEIAADGFRIDARVPMAPRADTNQAMAASVGTGIVGFARVFRRLRPDVVLVLGDRVEAFAAATAAALMNVVVAHVHGGDRAQAGHDDYMRHAITKLAHLHFAATRRSARRIARLGERRDRIWTVGAPGLDEIRTADLPPIDALLCTYFAGLNPQSAIRNPQFLLVVQHPVSTRSAEAAGEMRAVLRGVIRSGLPALVLYPNADAGGRAMIRVIERLARGSPVLRTAPSIPRAAYLAMLRHCAALVGNSSSGIIEAPSFRTPFVNVGDRQAGRERAANVIDVRPTAADVGRGIERAIHDPAFRRRLARVRNPYGDGRAGERIARVLARVPLDEALRLKSMTY